MLVKLLVNLQQDQDHRLRHLLLSQRFLLHHLHHRHQLHQLHLLQRCLQLLVQAIRLHQDRHLLLLPGLQLDLDLHHRQLDLELDLHHQQCLVVQSRADRHH
nr:unnamed protein product [Digitaria exilis]